MERSTVGSLLRSTQALCSQVCDKQTLEYGIAYYSRRFAALPEANQFREVSSDDPAKWSQAFDEAEQWFGGQDLCCLRWAPAGGQASAELAAVLESRGFQRRTTTAMALAEWIEIQPAGDVRVLHARAMRAALRKTFAETGSSPSLARRELLANACEERLNDPQFDMFVAIVDTVPAGRCALFQVGDVARVMDLSVLEPFGDRGVDRALMAHVLALAKRLTIRNICLQVDHSDLIKRTWFEHVGFVADGAIDEFDRRSPENINQTP